MLKHNARLLIVSHFFHPDESIGAQRVSAFARYFEEWGIPILVITTRKSPPSKHIPLHPLPRSIEVYEVDFVHPSIFLDRLRRENSRSDGTVSPKGAHSIITSFGKRLLARHSGRIPDRGFTDFWIRTAYRLGKQLVRERNVRWILSSYSPPASHIIAGRLKERFPRIRWIADYRDLWIENHAFPGTFPMTWIEKRLEARFMPKADLITTTTSPLGSVLEQKFGPKVQVIWNGFEEGGRATPGPSLGRNGSGLEIAYTGTIYPGKCDPLLLMKSLLELKTSGEITPENLRIRFVGRNLEYAKEQAHAAGVEAFVEFGGLVSLEKSLQIQEEADALLFLDWLDSSQAGIATGKIFEYIRWGKPILFLTHGGENVAREICGRSGLMLAASTVAECVSSLRSLMSGAFRVRPDWEYINQFQRKSQIRRLYETIAAMDGAR
ncbi:MAG: hypothetical protein HY788_16440 [Deltaproteobacteria bacterium]|nr:hypothetical protein [Deltaproteobacteria bacterium]